MMRRLFTGEEVTHRGPHFTVENARLYTVPDAPVPIDISGFGPKATGLAARVGDGFITMGPDEELVTQYRKGGGGANPVSGGTKVCWGPERDAAVRLVRRLWSSQLLPGEMAQILPTPSHFEQLEPLVTEQMVGENTVCGDDVDEHVDKLSAFADAGFDRVYVSQMAPTSAASSTSTARRCCRNSGRTPADQSRAGSRPEILGPDDVPSPHRLGPSFGRAHATPLACK